MHSTIIYDGLCNLCVNLVQLLERLDGGRQFRYVPMQDSEQLAHFGVASGQCEQGMILIDPTSPDWFQGSAAAEQIARRLPAGEAFIAAYRAVPGLQDLGDNCYIQVRDNRYAWFGSRDQVYRSLYPPFAAAN
ncbi:thiol-disulfide oxidoreductase DCC family protein [Gloeobacter kilaueensis]|uniref:Thiol-disulfide oxidoreductase DCC n=1 Tax=Gloeobacter kilaueensis (strain ATCC BAA-2537 / CCAP 1431/1 / ULC 316 / JS1) TaxID=1183438 RepID=U5QL02_GLOK1|nr:DUF393 domain-containing protein [Gloeobacter kilaueensis]AGY59558.1 hypothetical protein GKIL_3312 [Gloeobacter kilaueensis JS1]